MRRSLAKLAYLIAAVMFTAAVSLAQPPRPTERLYAILTLAGESGWTADFRREAADIYLALGDFDAALSHWEAGLLLAPDDVPMMRRIAEMYVQRERWPEAFDAIRRLLAATPDDTWANLHLGYILAPSDPTEAVNALRRAAQSGLPPPENLVAILEADRESPRSLALEVGTVMADARLFSYAERAFELAATMDTGRGEALALVALMRGLQGKDGQRWLDEALTLAPESPQAHTAAGLYYRAIGQSFLSLGAFATALSFAPLDPELYAELGRSYELIGALDTAAFWYGQAVQIAPGEERYLRLQRAILDLLDAQTITLPP